MALQLADRKGMDVSATELLGRYREELVRFLDERLPRGPALYAMVRYHLGLEDREGRTRSDALGKALRPTLCLLTCEALEGEWRRALPAAAAIEMLHNFSLVHDDVQDKDRERRHRPTVWALWGPEQAINAGDALHGLAVHFLLALDEEGFAPEVVHEGCRGLTGATLEMIEGQALDLSFEGRFDLGVDDYLEMISKKTGALMACALKIGGLLGRADEGALAALSEAGRNLGLAFQIRDDLLGIWGAPRHTGKPTSDILRKKRTLPIVFGLEHPESRDKLVHYFERESLRESDEEDVRGLLQEIGADRRAQERAEAHAESARCALEGASLSRWAREIFQELIAFSSSEREA